MWWMGLVAACVLGCVQPPAEEPEVDPGEFSPPAVALEAAPAQVRLGARVREARVGARALPVVVIVPDTGSYVAALGAWTREARFPVLIDDESPRAREDIARFVRGYRPTQVVTWRGGEGVLPAGRVRALAWPVIASAWGSERGTEAGVIARWREIGHTPPGVVVTSPSEGEWTGALALAAGHGQPIVWASSARGINRAMTTADADALEAAVQLAVKGWGWSWAGLGDDIDAMTICLPLPARVRIDDRTFMASTDYLGRAGGARWAWTGQIFGNEASSAYMAMSSLFLELDSAWIFDGYPDEGAWAAFDGTRAGQAARGAGLSAVVHDTPSQSDRVWRNETCRPIDAGLVLVNTKGNRSRFELNPGRCESGDVPFLHRPSVVHFVHSWSAVQVGARETIAGRWFERGAYAYVGAVQEPFLQAFVPTPLFVERLAAGAPWAAAARQDPTPVWKVAVFGDPLLMLGSAPRRDGVLPLGGAVNAEDLMKEALAGRDYARAVRYLTILGRDGDAARLAESVLRDDPGSFTEDMAEASLMPLFRAGSGSSVVRAFAMQSATMREQGFRRDALWHAAWPELGHTRDAGLVSVLMLHVRGDQAARDAIDLAPAVERVQGARAADTMLAEVRLKLATERERTEFDRMVREMRGR